MEGEGLGFWGPGSGFYGKDPGYTTRPLDKSIKTFEVSRSVATLKRSISISSFGIDGCGEGVRVRLWWEESVTYDQLRPL